MLDYSTLGDPGNYTQSRSDFFRLYAHDTYVTSRSNVNYHTEIDAIFEVEIGSYAVLPLHTDKFDIENDEIVGYIILATKAETIQKPHPPYDGIVELILQALPELL